MSRINMCVDKVHEYTYDIDGPRGELSSFDGVEQPLDAVIGVLTSKLAGFLVRESLRIHCEQVLNGRKRDIP